MLDRRRGARLHGAFWVSVVGADHGPRLRQGNMSISGAQFVTDVDYGEPGMVRRIRLGRVHDDFEQGRVVEVLARVVRVEVTAKISEAQILREVAFEYLIDEKGGRQLLEKLVRSAQRSQLIAKRDLDVSCHLPATITGANFKLPGVTVRRLRTESVVLWVDKPLSISCPVRIAVRSPCSHCNIYLHAMIKRCFPESDGGTLLRYTAEGRLVGDPSKSTAAALELASAALVPKENCQPLPLPHLNGNLGEINLFSLLGFLELERRTGVLRVESGSRYAFLYLDEGTLVDVEAVTAGESARQRLITVLTWTKGRFSLTLQDVNRKNRFGSSTMALLMDIAREKDEATAINEENDLEGFDEWTL